MSQIFLDLDGTLLESRTRLHRLFSHMVSDCTLTFEEYWRHKRAKISHAEILTKHLAWPPEKITEFENRWLELIEKPEWLALDEPLPGVTEALGRLATRHALYLVTARQMTGPVLEQVGRLGWPSLFTGVLVTGGHPSDKRRTSKESLIRRTVSSLQPSDWMVGDAGLDIRTGQALGVRTAAVLTGFLSRESLEPYKPDLIIPDLPAFASAML